MRMVRDFRPFHLDKCHHLVAAFGDALGLGGGDAILTRFHSQVVDTEHVFSSLSIVTHKV